MRSAWPSMLLPPVEETLSLNVTPVSVPFQARMALPEPRA